MGKTPDPDEGRVYVLIALAATPQWSGEIGREFFDTLEEAETEMKQWAQFGVDGYCNEADRISIFNDRLVELRRWNWATRKSESIAAGMSKKERSREQDCQQE
ncbi:MAG: hypothetical protein OXI87_02190 [Albidovulum sp.]|nr:hypothetical protein [Albidovulum sp.]MDE0303685.1 hypothetical protein [Albidovulum sp.]MDE0533191.1 hypothetical protein [Albidovulum sp.]